MKSTPNRFCSSAATAPKTASHFACRVLTRRPIHPHGPGGGWPALSSRAGLAALWALLALWLLAWPAPAAAPASPGSEILWTLGEPNGLSIEFAPGARDQLAFVIGKSVVSRDFAGHQNGSIGFDPARGGEKPYTIQFDLTEPPQGQYQLELDFFFRSGAPREMKIKVNAKTGIFPIRHSPKKDADGEEANAMLLGQQHLVVPIDGAWLKPQANQITLVPLGLGGLDYDAIRFQRAVATPARDSIQVVPSIFYPKRTGRLMETAHVLIPFNGRFTKGAATVHVDGDEFTQSFANTEFDFGVWLTPIDIPALKAPARIGVEAVLDELALRAEQDITPAKQWKIFICPKVHNDVGYTDLQPHVNELDNRNTDRALEIMDRFPFYKFNFETAWLVDNYLDCRPPGYRRQFLDSLKKGRSTINALYLNLMTGLCTGEELYRAMYFTHRLHREQGGNFDFACLTDAPSHSWFLPSLLTDVGVKAFSNGSNQTRAPILHFSDLNENSPFYWEGLNGERIFMWYARSYTQWKRLTGPDFLAKVANSDYLKTSVPQFLTRFLRTDYAPDAVMIYGAYVDNAAIPKTGEAELVEQWNQEFEFPKMVVASDAEYFAYIEKNFGPKLPVYRGDAGAYWEDGVASSAQATTLNRHSQQILPAAEFIASLASLYDPRNRYPVEDFRGAWKNVMFYNEHTWGAHNSVSQPDREFVTRQWEIKESYAKRANLDARNLLARAFNRLCQHMAVDGDTAFAFNTQNYPRTEPLEVEIDDSRHLVDLSTGKPVGLDIVFQTNGWRRVRFLAENVPALGYKGYAIRTLGSPPPSDTLKQDGATIESPFYRLTINLKTGGIQSLIDKSNNRELADTNAPYHLNQYVYVSGGEGSLILNHTFGTPPAKLILHPPHAARIVENVKTPVGQRIVVVASATNTPNLKFEYLLYDKIKRVDIRNTVDKKPTRAKEAVYFAFPFAAQQPAFEFQIQNGWCRPNQDQLPGACREWFTPQNLVHVRDGAFSVAWATPDAPLVNLTDINRGLWLSHLPIRNGHLFSYVMHNYWFTNYRAEQGGQFVFRYSITSDQNISREQLARFDADTRAPVLAYPFVSSFSAGVTGENRPLPPSSSSLFEVDQPNLQIVTLKEAEDQDGFILRLREIAGRNGQAELRLTTLSLREAYLCNGVEVSLKKLAATPHSVTVPYQPNQYITVRLKAQSALPKS